MNIHPDIKSSIAQSVVETLNTLRNISNARAIAQLESSVEDANSWIVENNSNPRHGRIMAERILHDAVERANQAWMQLESDPNKDGELDSPAYERRMG